MKRKGIPIRFRKYLFEFNKGMCWYCGVRPADHLDHIIAHHASKDDYILNLAPACRRCGIMKDDKVFCHREAARIYLQLRIMNENYPIAYTHAMPEVRYYVSKKPSLARLLLREVPESSDLYKEQTRLGGDEEENTGIDAVKTEHFA